MSHIKKAKNKLYEKYGISTAEWVEAYKNGDTLEDMVEKFNSTIHIMSKYSQVLRLRMPKKYRLNDLEIYEDELNHSIDRDLDPDTEHLLKENTRLTRALQRVRDENNTLRARDRKDVRTDTLEEKILDTFELEVSRMDLSSLDIAYPVLSDELSEEGLVVGISDWHIGEDVNKEELGGTNEFNYVEAEKRIQRYAQKIGTSRMVRSYNMKIVDLGDNLRGIIHGGKEASEGGLMESIIRCVDITAQFIVHMLHYVHTVDYYSVVGNHSRLDDVIESKGKYKDYSWLVVSMLERLFKGNKRVKFVMSKTGYNMIPINGANLLAFHGDTVRGYSPLSPNSRSNIQDMCLSLFDTNARHFFSGHTHTAVSVQNQYKGWNIISGCLPGSNEYGLQNGFTPIQTSQCAFFVEKDGSIEDIKHFDLKG